MLTASFAFCKVITPELERALWGRGILSWELARAQRDELLDILGPARTGKLLEALAEAQAALGRGDAAWFKANWPVEESWRLWRGYAGPGEAALVDIETTGLTPGFDQITVIGLADSNRARVYVAGRPQPGDENLDAFPAALRPYRLLVTYNGTRFDCEFIERHFKGTNFRFELPHLDLLILARELGLSGGLKDMEQQLGISRAADIKEVRGSEAIQLWGRWKAGDAESYRRLTVYCKADCSNLLPFADLLYRRRWEKVHTPYARPVDFDRMKGQQQSLF